MSDMRKKIYNSPLKSRSLKNFTFLWFCVYVLCSNKIISLTFNFLKMIIIVFKMQKIILIYKSKSRDLRKIVSELHNFLNQLLLCDKQ